MSPKNPKTWISENFILRLVAYGVMANGFILIANALASGIVLRTGRHVSDITVTSSLLIGLSFIYLATLLGRRKRTAWLLVVPLYALIFGINITQTILFAAQHDIELLGVVRNIVVPAVILGALIYYRRGFIVRSDIRNFTLSLRVIALILLVTLFYGVSGFLTLDKRDFRQEISLTGAIHHTIDRFDFTTDKQLVPYTRRAKIFVDSLNIISLGAFVYAGISLFRPLKARFSDQSQNREHAARLLKDYPASSEDFFKLWPRDKTYFFSPKGTAGLAYHVHNGVALVVGDLFGQPKSFSVVMNHFLELCRVNDWLPAFIHTAPNSSKLYKKYEFGLQKIGEEAIVDIANFQTTVRNNKYFRQINNKFTKQGYTTEMLHPPHNQAVINRLHEISSDWLKLPGRSERGLMMAYFSPEYMQRCSVMVARDAAGTMQAFINQIPSYDEAEGNYDLLRSTQSSLGNVNDFLLMNFIDYLEESGFKRFNLGLCPLAGLGNRDQDKTVVDSALQFVYANGDRFYSFSGLHRFKAKYEPNWDSRYIAYRGGIRGFTRTLNALNRAMSKIRKS